MYKTLGFGSVVGQFPRIERSDCEQMPWESVSTSVKMDVSGGKGGKISFFAIQECLPMMSHWRDWKMTMTPLTRTLGRHEGSHRDKCSYAYAGLSTSTGSPGFTRAMIDSKILSHTDK